MPVDLSTIITGHEEGRLSVASLRSMDIAIAEARADGLSVEAIYVLDNADDLTSELFKVAAGTAGKVIETTFGDQGEARNEAVREAKGKKLAFLDADDLFSRTWLKQAYRFLERAGDGVIAHPEFNYFFEGQATIFRHVDQDSKEFEHDMLRLQNYWDALGMCDASIHKKFPYDRRDINGGWAFEDWQWSCQTVAAGYIHKVVPETLLFKRRQLLSQTIEASRNKSRIRRNGLSAYSSKYYSEKQDTK